MATSASGLLPFDEKSTFKYTDKPTSDWKIGEKVEDSAFGREWVEGEKDGWKVVDPSTENPLKLYQLMISGIVPRPIAFVSTVSNDGVHNLAPFSWFNQVSTNPPVISVSCVNAGPGKYKDTARNIRESKGFTVSIISEPFVNNANVTSINAPEDVSEWPLSGLTMAPSIHVKAPRVKESAFVMECELYQIVEIKSPATGETTASLVLGLVKYIHVRKDVLNEDGIVDPTRFRAIGRLGDVTYTKVGDGFRIPRPSWSDDTKTIYESLV